MRVTEQSPPSSNIPSRGRLLRLQTRTNVTCLGKLELLRFAGAPSLSSGRTELLREVQDQPHWKEEVLSRSSCLQGRPRARVVVVTLYVTGFESFLLLYVTLLVTQ